MKPRVDGIEKSIALAALVAWGGMNGTGWSEPLNRFGYAPERGVSLAVKVESGDLLLTDQYFPPEGAGAGMDQIRSTFEALEGGLASAGSSSRDIVRLNVAARSDETVQKLEEFLKGRFDSDSAPAVSIMVGDLPKPDQQIAMDAVAAVRKDPPDPGPARLLPEGPRVYISGQAKPGDFETAVKETMQSLFSTLEFLGLGPADIVQLKAFLQPIDRAEEARRLMAEAFDGAVAPPIVTVEWLSTLPIEIELVASAKGRELRFGEWGNPVEWITPPGETASPVFSRLAYVRGSKAIYTSSLFGPPGSSGADQIHRIFGDLKILLGEAGSDFDHLVKATYHVSDEEASSKLNEIRPEYYHPSRPPAASKAMVRGAGRKGCGVGIDMIAVPSGEGEEKEK